MRGYFRTLVLTALIAASLTGCETGQPTKTVLPRQATAPEVTVLVEAKADPPPQPQVQPPPAPKPDPAESVIAQAEKQYASGEANYKAGHLEAARGDFDEAFDTLLSSNLDLRSDDRLQREFERIVDGIQQLEASALKQGDGFSPQRSTPAPIDEANDVTFPVDPNIKAKAEAEIKVTKSDLPLVLNDQVASFINYFSSPRGKLTLEHAWARSGRYRDMILRVLKGTGVPQDLIYLAQAESGFQPLALSRAGARGMWQFMAQSASLYGLERNWWVDERQDPEKATMAAAQHLKDLYHQFGDWYLAMAAYNSGASTVQHAVERTGYADFWELYQRGVLPKQTRNYVPIILAETIILKNPAQYGVELPPPEPPEASDSITIDYPVDLRLAAECVDSTLDTLQELNPSLLRLTTPKDQSFILHLPAGSREKYETAIAAIPSDMRTTWRYHHVEEGDSLATLARKYHVSVAAIEQANGLADGDLRAGGKLVIPIAAGLERVAYSHHPTRYKVRRGDTLYSVADNFEVPADKLRSWNHLRGTALTPGRTLVIYRPVEGGPQVASSSTSSQRPKPASKRSSTYHTVKKGETLSSIAQSYETSVAALKRDNPKLSATLRAGEVLVIRK